VDKGGVWYEGEGHRLTGEVLLRHTVPDVPQAEVCFQQALAAARRQQARALELRAALSLSRLWQEQGQRAEAYDRLAPTSGWLTEGLTRPTCKRRRRCWRSWPDRALRDDAHTQKGLTAMAISDPDVLVKLRIMQAF
jgi:predicted ATPase